MILTLDTPMADYFDAVEAAVREAQRKDPDVILPWSWWKEQAQQHNMTPNAIYTRAVKIGLYTPPDKRPSQDRSAAAPNLLPPSMRRGLDREIQTGAPSEDGPRSQSRSRFRSTPSPEPRAENPSSDSYLAPPRAESAPPGSMGEAMQSFASLWDRTAHLEQQVRELGRTLEETRSENRRLKRALYQVENLAEEMRHVYRVTLLDPDDPES